MLTCAILRKVLEMSLLDLSSLRLVSPPGGAETCFCCIPPESSLRPDHHLIGDNATSPNHSRGITKLSSWNLPDVIGTQYRQSLPNRLSSHVHRCGITGRPRWKFRDLFIESAATALWCYGRLDNIPEVHGRCHAQLNKVLGTSATARPSIESHTLGVLYKLPLSLSHPLS
jgi:hypothetical protein